MVTQSDGHPPKPSGIMPKDARKDQFLSRYEYSPNFSPEAPQTWVRCTFHLSPPDYGWIDLAMQVGDRDIDIELSNVYDPFEDIRHFLETIAQARPAELRVYDEGNWFVFRTGTPDAEDRVRLGLWTSRTWIEDADGCMQMECLVDVMTHQGDFLAGFYEAILDIWEKPSVLQFKIDWLNTSFETSDVGAATTEEEEEYSRLPVIRSPALDAFLQRRRG